MSLIVFNMVTGINESKTLIKHISCECKCKFGGRKYNSNQNWNNIKWRCEFKNIKEHHVCKIIFGVTATGLKPRTAQFANKHSTIWPNWPVWPNGCVFVYEISASGSKCRCSHLNFRFCACFEQGVPWHSGKYRVWIHSETITWHDKNIQSIWNSAACKCIGSIIDDSVIICDEIIEEEKLFQ